MGIRKFGLTILMAAFAVSLACGCGEKAAVSASVSDSVPESISSVSEKKTEVSVSEPEVIEEEFIYPTEVAFDNGLYEKVRETLLDKGAIDEDEKLFYYGYTDYEDERHDSKIHLVEVHERKCVFASFDEKGIKNIFVALYKEETNGKAAAIASLSVLTPEEYAKYIADNDGEYSSSPPWEFYDLFTTKLRCLRADSAEAVRDFVEKATADASFTEYTRVIDYVYEKAVDKEAFKDPIKAVQFFFPLLKQENPKCVKYEENAELVCFNVGDELVSVYCQNFDRLENGENLYYPARMYYGIPEVAEEWQKVVENITEADLIDGGGTFTKEGMIEGENTTLYGYDLYDNLYGMMILLTNGRIIPIYEYTDFLSDLFLHSGDYDGDGEKEYAIIVNDGHGTGFYREKLIVVDLGEEEPVCTINNDNLEFGRDNIYSKIKKEYDENTNELTYWLEDDGSSSPKKKLLFDKIIEEGETYQSMTFGYMFEITVKKDRLGFVSQGYVETDGYFHPYGQTLQLCGDLIYKNGVLTYDNLRLEAVINE